MKYLRVQCTPNLASADIGCVRYRNIHAEGAYCTLPLNVLKDCLVVLQSISIFFAFSKNVFCCLHRHSTKKIFRQIATFCWSWKLPPVISSWRSCWVFGNGWLDTWQVWGQTESNFHGRISPIFSPVSEATEEPYVLYVLYVLKIYDD